jgi:hypothetical protein
MKPGGNTGKKRSRSPDSGRRTIGRRPMLRTPFGAAVMAFVGFVVIVVGPGNAQAGVRFEKQSLDGSDNNLSHPSWGRGGTDYLRMAPAHYADGHSTPVSGPDPRYVSNRIFNDEVFDDSGGGPFGVNIFSETQDSQWGWTWGQFLDHDFGIRLGGLPTDRQGETANLPINSSDPLESVSGTGSVPFVRSAPAVGTGVTNARQQVNMESSYIDASNIYGSDPQRLEWLREGPVDGDMRNNGAHLLLPDGYLPRRDARGDPATAPKMEINGRLQSDPNGAIVAGDPRANENMALTATQTMFAREHNRIVDSLPKYLSEEQKFQIARRVVIAEIQYITYSEFLPSLGITLPAYRGYNPSVNATLSNEFATAGYRAHSMVHSGMPVTAETSRYTQAQLDSFEAQGLEVIYSEDHKTFTMDVPLGFLLDNPQLLKQVQVGPLLQTVGVKAQYKNDEMIDHDLRNVLCSPDGVEPKCVSDLGAIDLARGRDHGLPTYNDMRRAYGLPKRTSFTQITGEASDAFPSDPQLTPGNEINDPDSIDFTSITNLFGSQSGLVTIGDNTTDVNYVRRTPLAARLKAIYGSVDKVDAFVGMLSEPHSARSQFGELQQAIWTKEFQRLRDGDRFFYGNQLADLNAIRKAYGIDYRRNLGDLIATDTDIPRSGLSGNVFFVKGRVPPTGCQVKFTVDSQTGTGSGDFTASVKVTNTGDKPLNAWALRFRYADGQKIAGTHNSVLTQNNTDITLSNPATNGTIGPGKTVDMGFTGTWTGKNDNPVAFNLNTTPCAKR